MGPEVYINPFHLILKGGLKLGAVPAGSCRVYRCVWARNLRVKVPEPGFCRSFFDSSHVLYSCDLFNVHGSIWVSFMKMFVICSEFLDFAIASYCVIPAPEMNFARWKSVVRHVIYELNATAVFLHTIVCALLQKRF